MRFLNKKNIISVLLISVFLISFYSNVFAAASTTQSTAQPASIQQTDSQKGVLQLGVTLYALTGLASRVLALSAALIDFAVKLGNNVINLEAVQAGWSIMLSFANLGFILAIIIIAFATILRFENYGMKSVLAKLIIAALLVNFSLVIAGAIISFSNTASDFFLQATSTSSLSNALGNAIQPQKFGEIKSSEDGYTNYIKSYFSLSGWLQYFADIAFVLAFTLLSVLAFIALLIMLMVRVIALSLLLILSPIVWLLWIFPNTQKHWSKWWNEFIRWNIFAPAVLFFIYLTVLTASKMQSMGGTGGGTNVISSAITAVETGDVAKAVNNSTMLKDVFPHTANLIIVLGLLFGGIYVANAFGVIGAKWASSTAQNIGKGVTGWAGRKGLQISTYPLRRKYGKEEKSAAERASEGAVKASQRLNQSKLLKYTGLAYLASHAIGTGAQGVAKLSAKGEGLVKQAKDSLKDKSLNEQIAMYGYASTPTKIAIEQNLSEKGLLGKIPNFTKDFFTDKTKNTYASYGQGKGYGDIEKSLGMTLDMYKAAAKKDTKALKEATEKLVKSYNDKEASNIDWKSKYSKDPFSGLDKETHDLLVDAFTGEINNFNPGLFSKAMPKLAGNFDNFKKTIAKVVLPEEVDIIIKEKVKVDTGKIDKDNKIIYREEIKERIDKKKRDDLTDDELLDAIKEKNPKLHKALSKNFGNRLLGFTATEEKEEEK